jgi:hypothetical protein
MQFPQASCYFLVVPRVLIIVSSKLRYTTMNHFTKHPIWKIQYDFCMSVVEIESDHII